MEKIFIDRNPLRSRFATYYEYRLRKPVPNGNGVMVNYAGSSLNELRRIVKRMGGIPVDGWK